MVKIDMGAHIDGFIAVVAHTVVASDGQSKITGRKADVMMAAHLCAEAALRLVKPGNEVQCELDFLKLFTTKLTTFISRPTLSRIPFKRLLKASSASPLKECYLIN